MSSLYTAGSARGGSAVVPSDSTPVQANRLWIGGTGNVVVTMLDGQVLTFTAVPANTMLDISVTRVRAATTATNIVALY